MIKINIEEFCDQVSMKSEANVVSEQIMEAIGGISNLYLGNLIKTGKKEITFETYNAFATRKLKISKKSIVREISNCTGASLNRSKLILNNIKHILFDYIYKFEASYTKKPFDFKPIGIIKIVNIDKAHFQITYKDPSARNYNIFLLKWK
jgi:hypothetical protein